MKEYYLLLLLVLLAVDIVISQNITQIRFRGTNSNATQGRLEVLHAGVWGTVCDDNFRSAYEATVICKMLKIPNVNRGTAVSPSVFGPGTGPIWIDDLNCDGTETDISQCPRGGWNVSDCTHNEDVGVICDTSGLATTPSTPVTTKAPPVVQPSNCSVNNSYVRLIGPSNMRGIGFVEVNLNNQWGSVCDDLWGIDDAKVVCGMLCYNKDIARAGAPVEVDYVRQNVSLNTNIDDVECTGAETNILNCRYKTGSNISSNCNGNRDQFASVSCVELINAPPEDPVPDLDCKGESMTATFSKLRDPKLEEKHLSLSNGQTCANLVKDSDTNFVSISVPFGECGTNKTTNATHIIFTNTIRYDYTTQIGNRVRVNLYHVEVSCYFERDLTDNLDKEMQPLSQYVTQKAPGQFHVNMMFYRNNSFVHAEASYPLQLTLGEWLYVGLYLESIGANLKLIVPNCTATPSVNRSDPVNYPLFMDKCPNEDTLAFFPLNSTAFGYRYRTFKFVGYDSVIVHCSAFVCLLTEESASCDRSCNTTTSATTTPPPSGRRRRREADYHYHEPIYVTSPPIFFRHHNNGGPIIQREWDITNKPGSFSTVTVPMTVTTQKSTQRTFTSSTTTKTTTKEATPAPTTQKATKSTTQTTEKATTAAPDTQRPTTKRKPTTMMTSDYRKPTTTAPPTSTTEKASTTSTRTELEATTTQLKYTTSHKVVKVTEKTTPTPVSNVNNDQSGNNNYNTDKIDMKTTEKPPVVPSSKNSETVKEEKKIDLENDFFVAGLAGKPFSQSPPMFSVSQTLLSIIIMILSLVLLR